MNELSDDAIEALLRDQFDGPVPADDFCDLVVARVPPRRRFAGRLHLLGIAIGSVLSWLALRSVSFSSNGRRALDLGTFPGSGDIVLAAMCGAALLMLAWLIAELEDRPGRSPSDPTTHGAVGGFSQASSPAKLRPRVA